MNSKNSKTSDPHGLLSNLIEKIDLKRSDKYIVLSDKYLNIYCKLENMKKLYKNNKFKMSAPTWNGKFDLPHRSYSVSDIQDYFECI